MNKCRSALTTSPGISSRLIRLSFAVFFALAPATSVFAADKESDDDAVEIAPWSYAGDTGPNHWGDLKASYATCKSGKNQSPVDIRDAQDADLKPVKFDYHRLVPSRLVNNGQTVQVEMWSGGKVELDGISFELKQIQFHTPSEHTANGKHFPLEAQFIHQSEDKELAVVALLYVPGNDNPAINNLWKKMPLQAGKAERLGTYDLKTLEIEDELKHYYRFNGSLTTPPCTEGVRWVIMKQPYTVSRRQIEQLQQALKQPNNRPVQPLNARVIMD